MSSNNSHQHHHLHDSDVSSFKLFITMILNFIITIVEIIGGVLSGSLSLISDALHNFSDGIAIIISYVAIKLKKRPKNLSYTFGYKRAEILAAVFNSSVLIAISIYLFFEAYHRFVEPVVIKGNIMIIVASIGLFANIAGTLLLKSGSNESMNIRSVYLHLLSDSVSSLGVIIGGIFIVTLNIFWIDPLITVFISLYIIKESYRIVKDATSVLMMGSPQNISITEIEKEITKLKAVKNIHHVHLWQVNENDIHFEAHVKVTDMTVSQTELIQEEIEKLLHSKFNVSHVTLQFECDKCNNIGLINNVTNF